MLVLAEKFYSSAQQEEEKTQEIYRHKVNLYIHRSEDGKGDGSYVRQ